MVSPADSWPRRRRLYQAWLEAPGAFALVARLDGQLVAYALVSMHGSDALDDTWESGDTVAELQTLVVAPEGRRSGVGTQLLDAVEERLRESGTRDLLIGVVAGQRRRAALLRAPWRDAVLHADVPAPLAVIQSSSSSAARKRSFSARVP